MRIGFILQSSEYLHDPFRGDSFTHFCLLTALETHYGNRVELQLINLRGVKKEFAVYHIPECDVYLYTVYTLEYDEVCNVVTALRTEYPNATHIAGGPHVNVFPEETSAFFDAIVLGEGEEILIQAIDDASHHTLERVYRAKGLVDINAYSFWRRHFLPKSAVARKNLLTLRRTKGYENIVGTTVIFSRGCPYRCHFCSYEFITRNAPGIRFRRPELVEEEIVYLKREYGVEGISLLDEISLPLNMRDARAHLEALERSKIVWRGHIRVDGVSEEIAELAQKSGCVALSMGVESVVQECLDAINKRVRVEQARESIRILRKYGLEVRVCLMLGLPGEPPDIVDRTWAFIQETEPDFVFLSLLTIRPGTQMFAEPERFGIKSISTDWAKTMHMHGRYSEEIPELTFEYHENTPWGKSLDKDTIVQNYVALQTRLREGGFNY